jgi:hypothetical protein
MIFNDNENNIKIDSDNYNSNSQMTKLNTKEIIELKNKNKKSVLSRSVPIFNLQNNVGKNTNNKNIFCNQFKNILVNNILEKIPFEKRNLKESIFIIVQILIYLLQSFLFWNGLLNTEEYITKRFDEKNKIGFFYILTNEFNKYFFTSIFIIISLKLLKYFLDEIKINEYELSENSIEKIIFKKKFKIVLIEIIISVLHIFFSIFLYIFGNIYPNNKNLLLISACISLLFNLFIFLISILLSSFIMSLPFLCKCFINYQNTLNEIAKYFLTL